MAEKQLTLGTKILIGVLAGIACGIVFGELVAPFKFVGDVYVGLLQMTVLPYVTVSLTEKIGGLTMGTARRLVGRAGIVLVALWGVAIFTVLMMSLTLPAWDAGTFFSSSLVERPKEFDFLGLYLPTNPFHALANNVVPAVVLFSILVGVALIGVPSKERLLEPLRVLSETLGRISGFIVRLAPWGTFALAAFAAGTLSPTELERLAGYVSTFTIAVVLLSVVVLPGFAVAVTPIRYGQLLGGLSQATLAAFATGKLFAVLPMIIADTRRLLVEQGVSDEEAQTTADVFVPLGYPFPNAGKVLTLLFIPFAAWFIGSPLEVSQYPLLLSVGVLALFGSPVAAIPYLLDTMRLPSDLFPFFVIAGIWCARVGDVLGAVHLSVFTLVSSAWNLGVLRLRATPLLIWVGVATLGGVAAIVSNRLIIEESLKGQTNSKDLVRDMDFYTYGEEVSIHVDAVMSPNPVPRADGREHPAAHPEGEGAQSGVRARHSAVLLPQQCGQDGWLGGGSGSPLCRRSRRRGEVGPRPARRDRRGDSTRMLSTWRSVRFRRLSTVMAAIARPVHTSRSMRPCWFATMMQSCIEVWRRFSSRTRFVSVTKPVGCSSTRGAMWRPTCRWSRSRPWRRLRGERSPMSTAS